MQYPQGLYVSVTFSDATKQMIAEAIEKMNVSNPIPAKELHTTVLYSETPVESFDMFKSDTPLSAPITLTPHSFEVFGEEGESVLVLKVRSPKLFILHHTIKNATGSVPTYPTYEPHITLSYDCAEAAKWLSVNPADYITGPIEVVSIHTKPRQEDWAADVVDGEDE